jgi:hypothetical protein
MDSSDFQKLLAMLPVLSRHQCSVVLATVSALSAGPGAPSRRTRAKKETKGPSQKVSKYADNQDYLGYKQAQKELKSFLKQKGQTLKESEAESPNADPIRKFRTAQAVWFRSKAKLAAQDGTSEEKTSGGPEASQE